MPAGARLLGEAVSIENGIATVNLISGQLTAGESTRQNLWAQFVSTLTQDTGVTGVELSVDGVPVNIAGLDGPAGTLAEVGFTPAVTPTLARPVVRRGDDVGVFDPTTLGDQEPRQPVVSSSYPQVLHTFHRLALSADGTELAGVDPDGDGISRWRGTNRYEVPLDAVDVGNPSYDRRGYLWMGGVGTKDGQGSAALGRRPVGQPRRAARRGHRRSRRPGSRGGGCSSRGWRPTATGSPCSRPGSTGPTPGSTSPASCARAAACRSVSRSPCVLGASLTRATSLAWLDDRTLAAIGSLDGKTVRPVVLSVGGDVRGLTPVPDAVSVASTGGERDLWVVTSTGRLHRRAGSQWLDSGPATDLAVAAG